MADKCKPMVPYSRPVEINPSNIPQQKLKNINGTNFFLIKLANPFFLDRLVT